MVCLFILTAHISSQHIFIFVSCCISTRHESKKATINIIFSRKVGKDPISNGLALAINYINIELDVGFWSQQLSFFFVGLLIIFSIRGLLIQLLKVMGTQNIICTGKSRLTKMAYNEFFGSYYKR